MAGPYYVNSARPDDSGSGLTWAAAKKTLAGALAVAAAGERIWVSQAHAETQATSITLTSLGTAALPVEILCGNDGAEPPTALATTATITATGASSITLAGHAYVYGITFNTGTSTGGSNFGSSATTSWWWKFDNCVIKLLSTATTNRIFVGSSNLTPDSGYEFIDTSVQFSNAAQAITLGSRLRWQGGSILLGTAPTGGLFKLGAGVPSEALIFGVDLSNIGTNPLVGVGTGAMGGIIDFKRCKIAAGTTLTTGTNPGPGQTRVRMLNCDSGDTNYRTQYHQYEGDVYSEAVVVRTGGVSDGVTPQSLKMVSSAGAGFVHPLVSPEFFIWNSVVGVPRTVTVEIEHDSVTPLTDAEIGLRLKYLGTSGFPLGAVAHDLKASIIAAAVNQTASSVAWTTTGHANPNKQKLEVSFTPQEVGYLVCEVVLAKPSYTQGVYVDYKPSVA